ncbi:hypothetical protein MalM14_02380 [Gimesia chilikensis]|nr:hypothetical protein MalM14_02380 [Gimesia chilikensis]
MDDRPGGSGEINRSQLVSGFQIRTSAETQLTVPCRARYCGRKRLDVETRATTVPRLAYSLYYKVSEISETISRLVS